MTDLDRLPGGRFRLAGREQPRHDEMLHNLLGLAVLIGKLDHRPRVFAALAGRDQSDHHPPGHRLLAPIEM